MTRKALARRIAEVLFNEPATRRGAGAAPTRRAARILAGCFVARRSKTTAGILPPRRAPSQNSQQRCYTSLRLGAPVASPVVGFAPSLDVRRRIARERVPTVGKDMAGLFGRGHQSRRGSFRAGSPVQRCEQFS